MRSPWFPSGRHPPNPPPGRRTRDRIRSPGFPRRRPHGSGSPAGRRSSPRRRHPALRAPCASPRRPPTRRATGVRRTNWSRRREKCACPVPAGSTARGPRGRTGSRRMRDAGGSNRDAPPPWGPCRCCGRHRRGGQRALDFGRNSWAPPRHLLYGQGEITAAMCRFVADAASDGSHWRCRRRGIMAVVLAYTSPAIGHLFPFCALLGELASRGHQVHVRTLDAGVMVCRRLGFAAERVDPGIESLQSDDWTTGSALRVVGKSVEVLARRAAIEVADIGAAIRSVKPDMVLVDANCWGAISTLEVQRIQKTPWLIFSPFIPYLTGPGSPPFGPGARPRGGWVGRVRDIGIGPVTA